jgi:hypothetical protein
VQVLQRTHLAVVMSMRHAPHGLWHGCCNLRVSSSYRITTGAGRRDHMDRINNENGKLGYLLLWLLGVPLPILLVLFLIFR